jgi:hypothetical protein
LGGVQIGKDRDQQEEKTMCVDNIKMDRAVWTGLFWLRIETGGELL